MENFENEVIKSEKIVLVDFYATWCMPCQMLSPIIEEIANEYKDKLKVYKVNVDEEQELAIKYEVMSIPTLKFFKDGEVVKTSVGLVSKTELKDLIDNVIGE